MEGPSIKYIYKCKNRKCKSFRKKITLLLSPTSHLAKNNELPKCDQCQEPLEFVRMHYTKEVFSSAEAKVELSISDSELSNIIRTAEKTVRDKESGGEGSLL